MELAIDGVPKMEEIDDSSIVESKGLVKSRGVRSLVEDSLGGLKRILGVSVRPFDSFAAFFAIFLAVRNGESCRVV